MSSLKAIIAPSVLASNISKLAEETQRMEELGAEWIHLDVMDMHFVPNLSFGPPVINDLKKYTKDIFFDVHLMVENPEKYVDLLKTSDQLTFHFEALNEDTDKCVKLAQQIRNNNQWCGVSIKPKTNVEKIVPLLDTNLINTVLVMTVEPGFGGQSFMHDMMSKVAFLRKKYTDLNIQVDGGLNIETTEISASHGANVIVAGTSIFKADNPKFVIDTMRESVRKHLQK
ncbi:D-ribulose-5-phosphate 3-epimerase, putative [Plasmodium knowlesi strain H]|uniref:Ribulose-phosphate 3-epimerase n=3 Tax=Plasmodium knowlesi TaxID=5850 RepID=A0A5K1V1M2_PLAKH|nr:ribulose-phosphate 3-epimerase, putative [Plasmodium knowlesi strain H]OTN63852.1 Ribulose-phosphate 3-epimerase [Plasmodium knowlesi]CAA9990987.1 ribulose-phosphate 3-epimerase, putative [Plasmodium knowlesi strain H]SBO20755.1 D-ribulose-5-phosphate 3-epimerase, putative [Plasmodium knowlesi strain H]SBO21212.1 D-ribulose-5-phosphate 3-epimerase, putative [Plasmodium knowlesi strain H]VVS80461.1 ribulose-phosphate 3-epimerase, putative [Plasmodium knowlesi strain H]|eukprot:XP_002262269.1 d-ribulose-5-phosphate 3-epimerase, putative [Plasmodium knowlesi strain H]